MNRSSLGRVVCRLVYSKTCVRKIGISPPFAVSRHSLPLSQRASPPSVIRHPAWSATSSLIARSTEASERILSIQVRVYLWLCPKCGWALNRRLCFPPICRAAMTCPGFGGAIVATDHAVIQSWRMARQLYGVLVTWTALVILSHFFQWGMSREADLLAAEFVGWLPGVFPGILLTTILGESVGKAVASSPGLRESSQGTQWQHLTEAPCRAERGSRKYERMKARKKQLGELRQRKNWNRAVAR
jgi:hypothetical protein